uniref:Uncharacterized protein n=1 Tax=Setaria italica TaxID=4555 RepID=K4A3J3_SETIT
MVHLHKESIKLLGQGKSEFYRLRLWMTVSLLWFLDIGSSAVSRFHSSF